jgi:hypothetical protein
MCSQRLPRPGKLCRECERELDRARLAANTVAGLAPLGPPLAAPAVEMLPADPAWPARLRSRASIAIAAAFAVGFAGAIVLYVGQGSAASAGDASVMLDRDVSAVKPRQFAPRTAAPAVSAATAEPRRSPVKRSSSEPPPVSVVVARAKGDETPRVLDRVLELSDALAHCASETYFERIVCEQRARSRYCDGANRMPQCAEETPRDPGN